MYYLYIVCTVIYYEKTEVAICDVIAQNVLGLGYNSNKHKVDIFIGRRLVSKYFIYCVLIPH